jgi:hypothetical protein
LANGVEYLGLGGLHLELGRFSPQGAFVAALQQLIEAKDVGSLCRHVLAGGGQGTTRAIEIELLGTERQRRVGPYRGGEALRPGEVDAIAGGDDRQIGLQQNLFGPLQC